MYQIENENIYRLFIPPLIIGTIWTTCCMFLGPTEFKSANMVNELKQFYNEDSYRVSYISAIYYYTDEDGTFRVGWGDYLIMAIIVGELWSVAIFIVFCGRKTYQQMCKNTGMSQRTKVLNRQMFRALVIQTIVPVLMMFTPVGGAIVMPMFGVELGSMSNAPCMYAGMYPAIDALVAIFMIKEFRNYILCRSEGKNNIVTSAHESSIHN